VSRVARAVFVLLVGATFAAFFVAQGLKSAPALMRFEGTLSYFSPNGNGIRDVNSFAVTVNESDEITVSVVDSDQNEVRRIATGVRVQAERPERFEWDGRTDEGEVAPDGVYHLRVNLRDQNRTVTSRRRIRLDTEPPRPRLDLVDESRHVVAPLARPIEVRMRGAAVNRPPRFRVWRTDVAQAREVASFRGERGERTATWNGRVDGEPAPPGVYLVEALVRDRAGNTGSSAPGLPERPLEVRGRAGVTIRDLAVAPPKVAVPAGRPATFFVDARGRSYEWRLRRLGDDSVVDRGRSRGARLRVLAPTGDSGGYRLTLRVGDVSVSTVFFVQAQRRQRLLVVVPMISWLGDDPVDDHGDGLPDTLRAGVPVRHQARVFPGRGSLPGRLVREVLPLLAYLDAAGIRYDINTDVALARTGQPRTERYAGVLLAGPFTWVSRQLAERLSGYAEDGGRVASFGAQTLRRGVTVGEGRLVRPTQPTPDDPFGARLADARRLEEPTQLAPLPGTRAEHRLLTAWSGVLGGFSVLEESEAQPDRPDPVVALGQGLTERDIARAEAEEELPREPRPALTATRAGEGIVVRVGLPEWAGRLDDPDVNQITRNIVDLLRGTAPRPRDPLP
jgi:hypothetical protein